jgi:hypothetical protein
MFGGRLLSEVDDRSLALPDNLGGNLVEDNDRFIPPPSVPPPEGFQAEANARA